MAGRGVLALYVVRPPLRCRWCRAIVELTDATEEGHDASTVIDYRCPRCRCLYQSFLGAWE